MLLDELATYLIGAGIVASVGKANLPPGPPDDALAIYGYPGLAPEYVLDNSLHSVELPRFQLVARSRNYATAELLLERASRELGRVANMMIGGTWYRRIRLLTSGSVELEPDGSNRTLLARNFQAEKGLSPI